MNGKIAAVLLAATMLTTPAFAATVANSHNTPATQTVTPDKVTKMSDKGVKKHRIMRPRRMVTRSIMLSMRCQIR